MGTVYRARHIEVGRLFAIKVLHRRFLGDERVRRRFAREAELAGSLHHANVVSVLDVGETPEGLRYLVMEYADGRTLCELIRETAPMSNTRVISIVRQLCDGLQHAHERGLIHRDFKTENVILEQDRHGIDTLRIFDFGFAILRDEAAASGSERLTTAGLVLGTPHYMAPELAIDEAIDHRIDLFALGVMCFEMLTGRPPFDGDGVDVARANVVLATPAMSDRAPDLDVDPLLEAFTRKLMMKSRNDRPATAKAARELIDLIERDRPAAARALGVTLPDHAASPEPTSNRVPRVLRNLLATDETMEPLAPARSRRAGIAIAAVAGLVGLVGIVGIATLVVTVRRPAEPPAPALAAVSLVDAGVADAPAATTDDPRPPAIATASHIAVRPSVANKPVSRSASPSQDTDEPPASARRSALRSTQPVEPPAALHPVSTAPGPRGAQIVAQGASLPADASDASARGAAAPASATSIAELYAIVGQHLKKLDQAHGSTATADLWPLFLRIRINDVITDPAKRKEAELSLHQLDDLIADRSR